MVNLDIKSALTEHERASLAQAPEHPVGASGLPVPPAIVPEKNLTAEQWGVIAFLVSEVAFFGALITAYITYLGADTSGPKPGEVLSLPLVLLSTSILLASSGTIHLAESLLHQGRARQFLFAWTATIALGIAFLSATAYEWHELIYEHGLTISRNLFGTTFYTLIGFHALHVTIGVVIMLIVLVLTLFGNLAGKNGPVVQLVSWYWHFVDAVWLVVFALVYVIGR